MAQLSQGGVAQLLAGSTSGTFRLQVIACKKLEPKQGQSGTRYKILVSDGQQASSCILASQLAHLAATGEVREGTIVDIHECLANQMNNKSVLIVLNMVVVQQDVPRIGNPVTVQPGAVPPPQGQLAPAPPAPQQAYANPYGAPNGNQVPQPYQQQQPAGGYGAPPPQSNGPYGAPPPNPYGAPPPAGGPGGYGAPPPNPYGAPPPAAGNPHYGGNGAPAGGPMPNPYGAPHPAAGGAPNYRPAAGGSIARNEAPPNLMPINALNSYQNRWTIKARVTQKSEIRRYNNAKGDGKFFSFDLLDAEGGEIRAVGWNDQCDKFYDQVEVGRVYFVSKASLRTKRGNYNQTRHQFEIHLDAHTLLEPTAEETAIPRIQFNFTPLAQLEDTPAGSMVDVIAVVESVMEPSEINRRDGSQATKRSVSVRDNSGRSIEITLWGGYAAAPGNDLAAAVAAGQHPILAVKSARVGDYNGKTLSTVSSSTVVVDPVDPPEAGQLRAWYDNGGAAVAAHALSSGRVGGGRVDRRVSMAQIRSEGLGLGGHTAWVQVLAHPTFLRNENFCYPACTLQYNGKPCHKKLQDQGDGTSWYCERCGASVTQPDYRYILSANIGDHTEAAWVTAFNEAAPELLNGLPAGELKAWGDNDDPRFGIAFKDAASEPLVIKLKVSEDTYQDEVKLRYTAIKADKPDYVQETRWTLDAIARLEKGEPAFPQVASGPQSGAAAGGHEPNFNQQAPGYGAPAAGYGAPAGGYGYGGGYGAPAPPQQQWGPGQAQGGAYGGGYGGGYGAPRGGGYGGGGGSW